MKQRNLFTLIALIAVTVYMSSCSVIGGIFKMGMGFGIFLVVLVVALIGFLVMRSSNK